MKKPQWMFGFALLAVAAFALLLGGEKGLGASPIDKSGSDVEVSIDNFSFGMATLTIPAGAKVTWTNRDDIPHTVVSTDNLLFKSPALDTGEKFSYTFTKPGTYTYFCSIHPKMTAKIVVQ